MLERGVSKGGRREGEECDPQGGLQGQQGASGKGYVNFFVRFFCERRVARRVRRVAACWLILKLPVTICRFSAAWKFVEDHKHEISWDLVVICPPLVCLTQLRVSAALTSGHRTDRLSASVIFIQVLGVSTTVFTLCHLASSSSEFGCCHPLYCICIHPPARI